MVDLIPGHEPWSNLPKDPAARVRELRCRLKGWREMLPCDYTGITATLPAVMRDLHKGGKWSRPVRVGGDLAWTSPSRVLGCYQVGL